MNFASANTEQVVSYINEHWCGKDDNYAPCKEDTKEAIYDLYHFDRTNLSDESSIYDWFIKMFGMTPSTNNSFYRAFIILKIDEVLNLRLSKHFSTRNSAKRAFKMAIPDMEYHIVLERIGTEPIDKSKDIYKTMKVKSVPILVYDISLSDLLDDENGDAAITDLIYYLTNGTSTIKETKQDRKMKNTITESQLRQIISESIKKVLKETEDSDGRYYDALETVAKADALCQDLLDNAYDMYKNGIAKYDADIPIAIGKVKSALQELEYLMRRKYRYDVSSYSRPKLMRDRLLLRSVDEPR